MLNGKQYDFLQAACAGSGNLPPHLAHPFVAEVEGVRWILATDGRRMHAVRVPKGLDAPLGWCVVSPFGDVHAIDGKAEKPPSAEKAWWTGQREARKVDLSKLAACASVEAPMYLALTAASEPSVSGSWEPQPADEVRLNPRYVRDAIIIGRGDHGPDNDDRAWLLESFEPVCMGDYYVEVYRDGQEDPVVIQHDDPTPQWRAVVMPVRAAK